LAFTTALAVELATDHVCLNCVRPSSLDTSFSHPPVDLAGGLTNREKMVELQVPLGPQGAPEQVSPGCVVLGLWRLWVHDWRDDGHRRRG
jgi:NAD(P)-dependent dehydrogenase (short-subunit alcohol dehydrogenase family)